VIGNGQVFVLKAHYGWFANRDIKKVQEGCIESFGIDQKHINMLDSNMLKESAES
jgi:hypothetical protein